MKKLLLIPFLFIALFSCKQEPAPIIIPDPKPTDQDPAQYGTPFAGIPATQDIVMYEVNLRAFSQNGNLEGVRQRLDSIKSLGVNVIWLMPIYPVGVLNSVGQMGSPYSVKNYQEVGAEYGTLDDLRKLVADAHDKNMAVVLDWVANHTAWDNPWISNTPWYSQDGNGNIIIPPGTNWQDVADLNFNNAEMRLAMIKALKYWVLTANVDGFRCDAADFVPFDFWKQAIDSLKSVPNRQLILLAEGSRKDHFDAGFQMNYAWDYYAKLKDVYGNNYSAAGLFTANTLELASIPADVTKLRFTSNHDECAWDNTPLVLFKSKEGSIGAFVNAALMGGVPLIYNGQEVGCAVKLPFFSRSPIDWSINPDMTATYKKILAFRKGSEAAKQGSLTFVNNTNIAVFSKTYQQETIWVLVNTRGNEVTYNVPVALANTTWTNAMDETAVSVGTQVVLPAYGFLILK